MAESLDVLRTELEPTSGDEADRWQAPLVDEAMYALTVHAEDRRNVVRREESPGGFNSHARVSARRAPFPESRHILLRRTRLKHALHGSIELGEELLAGQLAGSELQHDGEHLLHLAGVDSVGRLAG